MTGAWLRALVTQRPARLGAVAAGVATAVALIACLGMFLVASKATMTSRATQGVAVDWQVQIQPGTDSATAALALTRTSGVSKVSTVQFGQSPGLAATTSGTTQTTGAAVVLGLPADYLRNFPGQVRLLVGSFSGVVLAQQTAANLHVTVGDTVKIGRAGLPAFSVTVTGIVDLPKADSLFQRIGAPAGAAPTAPPDNVVLEPTTDWNAAFGPLAKTRPDLISTQLHVAYEPALSSDPASAYAAVATAGRHLEAELSGGVLVGNNLAAALDAARGDAAYAQILFLFLGAPAIILAGLLTAVVAGAGRPHRRREQALLRTRGFTTRQVLRLDLGETLIVGLVGGVLGLLAAGVIGRVAFGSASLGATTSAAMTLGGLAIVLGLAVAGIAVLLPAYRDNQRRTSVDLATDAQRRTPLALRLGLDILALAGSGLVFYLSGRNGYQIVLVPEGLVTISVSYWAMAGPALLWLGGGLLLWRLVDLLLRHGQRLLTIVLRPIAGELAGLVAATTTRQRGPVTRSVVLFALACVFAISTATFNATYRQQAEADALLTNGADVTVTESPGASVSGARVDQLRAVPGVRSVQPLQHRYAYIGSDLQDLYGVNPTTITSATALQDSYFVGGTAVQLMHDLSTRPDSILVSAETVTDFQLHLGDRITLKLMNEKTQQLTMVTFHYAGVVTEFPTAPKDSFFVANSTYIAQQTGSPSAAAFLVDTGGQDTAAVATRVRALVGESAAVTSLDSVRSQVGSSLTSVDLAGLTRVELGFAAILGVASGALVFGLGLAERRRFFGIATALGATRREIGAFVYGDASLIVVGSVLGGTGLGWLLTRMLINVLTGVFDPPPSTISVPYGYLVAVVAGSAAVILAVAAAASRLAGRNPLPALRRL